MKRACAWVRHILFCSTFSIEEAERFPAKLWKVPCFGLSIPRRRNWHCADLSASVHACVKTAHTNMSKPIFSTYKHKQTHILILTCFKAHISLTCNVLMQARMSLSVFSHKAIRVPVSAFIPCPLVICNQKQQLAWLHIQTFTKSYCRHVSACVCHLC